MNWLLVPLFYCALGLQLELPALAIQYYAKDVLLLSPVHMGLLRVAVVSPWFFKFVYGVVSDALPVRGEHRRPYLVGASALTAASWLALAVPGAHSRGVVGVCALLFCTNLFACIADVAVDCLLAAQARAEVLAGKPSRVQALTWLVRLVGSLIGTLLGSALVAHVRNIHVVFALTAAVPAVIAVAGTRLVEPPSADADADALDGSSAAARIAHRLRTAYERERREPVFRALARFMFVYAATPNASESFFYFLTEQLHFSKAFIGVLSVTASVAGIAGLMAYRTWLAECAWLPLVRASIVAGSALSLTQLVLITRATRALSIDDRYFALGDDVVEAFVDQFTMMPLFVIAGAACPDGDEGLLYAGLMSVTNVGGAASSLFGAVLAAQFHITRTSFQWLWALVCTCAVLNLTPLLFMRDLRLAIDYVDAKRQRLNGGDGATAAITGTCTELEFDLDLEAPARYNAPST